MIKNYPKRLHTMKINLNLMQELLTCPCPKEIADSFLEKRISSANLYKSAAGSVPAERTKISGVTGDDSLKTAARSLDCGSMKR